MKYIAVYMIVVLWTVFAGCAPSQMSVDQVHTSSPAVRAADNSFYEARLEPMKRDKNFFVSFRLSVTNISDNDLEIDWNKTRWMHNDKNLGGLVFKGIDPEAFKESRIPADVIAAGETFTREIMPYKLVAWTPIRSQNLSRGQVGITPGMIPPGKNGVILVVRQGGKPILEEMMLDIKAENP